VKETRRLSGWLTQHSHAMTPRMVFYWVSKLSTCMNFGSSFRGLDVAVGGRRVLKTMPFSVLYPLPTPYSHHIHDV